MSNTTRIPDFPETVPLLEVEELCIGQYHISDDCGCLYYWTGRVFTDSLSQPACFEAKQYRRVETRIKQALKNELGIYLTTFVDVGKYTQQELADGWNRAMKKLGYTVECDRSEWKREQKKVRT